MTTDSTREHLRTALADLAPTTATVRTVPVWTDATGTPRIATWVTLDDADGRPVPADRAAHRAARDLLRAAFPGADWSRMHAYDVHLGRLLTLAAPTGPRELGTHEGGPRA